MIGARRVASRGRNRPVGAAVGRDYPAPRGRRAPAVRSGESTWPVSRGRVTAWPSASTGPVGVLDLRRARRRLRLRRRPRVRRAVRPGPVPLLLDRLGGPLSRGGLRSPTPGSTAATCWSPPRCPTAPARTSPASACRAAASSRRRVRCPSSGSASPRRRGRWPAGSRPAPTSATLHEVAVALLVVAAVVGVLPGRAGTPRTGSSSHRSSPRAAAFAVAWDPHPARLPMVLGIAALVAAVGRRGRACAGAAVGGGAAGLDRGRGRLLPGHRARRRCSGLAPQVAWARAPGRPPCWPPGSSRRFAIDVPDQLLIDLERLAVTAWSARDRPRGPSRSRRGPGGGGRRRRRSAGPGIVTARTASRSSSWPCVSAPLLLADRDPRRWTGSGRAAWSSSRGRAAARGTQLPARGGRGRCCGRPASAAGTALASWCCPTRPARRRPCWRRCAILLAALLVVVAGRHGPGLALGVVGASGRGGRGALRLRGGGLAARGRRTLPQPVGIGAPRCLAR